MGPAPTLTMPLPDRATALLDKRLRELLGMRAWPKTICPSEVARALSPADLRELGASDWRDTMADIREVVFRLRDSGDVEVLQKGEVVADSVCPATLHGPIRVRGKRNTE